MLKRSLALALLFSFIIGVFSLHSAETEKLTREQLLALRTKISEYKKIKDYEARKPVVDEILKIGPKGAVELYKVIERETLSLMKRYTSSLGKKAKSIQRKKLKRSQEKEVNDLRKILAGLRSKGANLGKGEIVDKGDPALAKLKELLLLSTDELIANDDKLQAMRKPIVVLGGYIDKCQDIMPDMSHTIPRSKKKYGKKDLTPPQEKIPFMTKFERSEKIAIVMETLAPKNDARVLKDNEKQTQYIDYKESLGILDLNIIRMLLGLRPLRIDIKLCAAARDHSYDMRTKNFFAHESPVKGKKTPYDRARNWGAVATSENIAMGRASAEQTNIQWFHSPGHHVNMLNDDLVHMGLGRSEKYWTQLFRREEK